MELFDTVDTLDIEIVNVQILDQYFRNGNVYLGSYFYRDSYIQNDLKLSMLMTNNLKNIIVVDDDEKDLGEVTLDDIFEDLIASIDIYSHIYRVGSLTIRNSEWETFFTRVAEYYCRHGFEDFFIEDADMINKMALASHLVYGEDEITLKTYIRSLRYMESDILSSSNIIELAEDLGRAFNIDALSIIANEDGNIRCIGIDDPVFLDLDEIDENSVITVLKERLEAYNYTVVEKKDEDYSCSTSKQKENQKVINFDTYFSKRSK